MNTKLNLCDTCTYEYPVCHAGMSDVTFGDGIGNDNICGCLQYRKKPNTISFIFWLIIKIFIGVLFMFFHIFMIFFCSALMLFIKWPAMILLRTAQKIDQIFNWYGKIASKFVKKWRTLR